MKAVLIQCTNEKQTEKAPAKDLYSPSPYFRLMWKWAQLKDGDVFIISSKHGLVEPDEELEPYNQFGLEKYTARDIAFELADNGYTVCSVCLGTHDYLDVLQPELEKVGISVRDQFHGMRIGERMGQLKENTRELENHSLC